MIITEPTARLDSVIQVAHAMMTAARTAPKGRGRDTIEVALVTDHDILTIANHMRSLGTERNTPSMLRDANNLTQAQALVLIGTRIEPLGLPVCGLCGFANCAAKRQAPQVPCSFNTIDLGIAIGSAVSIATDARVDNRIMYTAGLAAAQLGILGPDVPTIFGIPLSISSKNPFFDR